MAFGIDDIIGGVLGILNKFIPDPEARAKALAEMQKLEADARAQQLAVNAAEAASGSVFIGGWRPFIGWVCGAAFAWQFVLAPMATWGAAAAGHPLPPLPTLDNALWELLFGMLGLGGLRTFEKVKGIAK